jgi:hypothetical protein
LIFDLDELFKFKLYPSKRIIVAQDCMQLHTLRERAAGRLKNRKSHGLPLSAISAAKNDRNDET